MNEQEQELVKKYLRYIRKKRIIIISIIFLFISAGIIFFVINFNKLPLNNETIYQEKIDENTVNENVTNNISNTISENKDEEKIENKKETITEIKPVVEKPKEVVETSKPNATTSSKKEEVKQEKAKPSNKDFLFTDGYTMDNVTNVARDYLKSSGYAGECIPLKDNEGIYIGMRVIFY